MAAGAGFVYNAGERVLSTTTPLYALILAVARMLGADVPTVSNALGAASLALGGLAFWELGRAWRTPAAGLVGMIAFPLFPLLATTLGSEVALYLALTLGGFLAYARERYLPVALLLGLAALVRADGVLAAGLIGRALGLQGQTLMSLVPKSVTTPIAMGISEQLGGLPSLTAVLVILTGIFGSVAGPPLLALLRADDDSVRGFALGIAAHGIGTARALQISEQAGAFAGLAMGLNGAVTTIVAPLLVWLLRG
ncbi:hypothetical protein SE17_13805 [Kouleothrix aurantiaca]|uniref:LrgB n=1 Tax=Kouleothrix aurantiaca TaxID=186479 RepID=A0A0P9F830_9CHLR|nr:hypothetical protein SE17_13805 [Kouleothrix aurantiaca]